jgi:hypothetical protein
MAAKSVATFFGGKHRGIAAQIRKMVVECGAVFTCPDDASILLAMSSSYQASKHYLDPAKNRVVWILQGDQKALAGGKVIRIDTREGRRSLKKILS